LEIKELNDYYKSSRLRYGKDIDLLIQPNTIKTTETLKQLKNTIEKTEFKLAHKKV
jgi:hypothetical protein